MTSWIVYDSGRFDHVHISDPQEAHIVGTCLECGGEIYPGEGRGMDGYLLHRDGCFWERGLRMLDGMFPGINSEVDTCLICRKPIEPGDGRHVEDGYVHWDWCWQEWCLEELDHMFPDVEGC